MRMITILLVTFSIMAAVTVHARVLRLYEGKLNINAASAADLTRLPGVGEIIAFRIVKERENRGGFKNIHELRDIKGISARVYDNLKEHVATQGQNRLKVFIDLNTITKPLLLGLPGMSEGQARSILSFRKGRNGFTKTEDLLLVPGIDKKRYAELCEWVTVVQAE